MPPLSFFHHYPLKFKLNLVGYLYRADLRSARRERQHSIKNAIVSLQQLKFVRHTRYAIEIGEILNDACKEKKPDRDCPIKSGQGDSMKTKGSGRFSHS